MFPISAHCCLVRLHFVFCFLLHNLSCHYSSSLFRHFHSLLSFISLIARRLPFTMATKTVDVLQAQIQKLTSEAEKIQNEVSSQNLKFTVVNTRLDEIILTITQLKGFQSQLKRGSPQQSGSRLLLDLGTAGFGNSQVRSSSNPPL